MFRLVLFVLLVAAIALALTSVMLALRSYALPAAKPEDTMPTTFRNIAYVLLILLMFGVVTGWLGAA
jgi:cell division protein FtsX